MQSASNAAPSEERIRVRAYLLWEADGRQHGRDDHYWDEAVEQLQIESALPSQAFLSEVPSAAKVKKTSKVVKGGENKVVKTSSAAAVKKSKSADAEEPKAKRSKKPSKAAIKGTDGLPESEMAVKASSTATSKKKAEASDVAPVRPKKPRKSTDNAQSSAQ
jgi:hypothetical protein